MLMTAEEIPRSEAEYMSNCAMTYSNDVSTIPWGLIKTPHNAMKTAEMRANPEKIVFEVMICRECWVVLVRRSKMASHHQKSVMSA